MNGLNSKRKNGSLFLIVYIVLYFMGKVIVPGKNMELLGKKTMSFGENAPA